MENKYCIKAISINRLNDLEKDVESIKNSDLYSELIDIITSNFYSFKLPEAPFEIKSIIVAAMPKPLVRVKFNYMDKCISLLHHTFVEVDKQKDFKSELGELLQSQYSLIDAPALPQKLLAVRSGLVKYGRNNITYVKEMGSLHELITFYSDMPVEDNHWYDIMQMDFCKNCEVCINKCPTAAITKDRFLIKAERCLTYLNEFVWPMERDFPSWLDASAHNCIHGCIICQTNCPQNRGYINDIVGNVEFTREETLMLLEGKCLEKLPQELIHKLKELNLAEDYFSLIPRNLKVLFESQLQT